MKESIKSVENSPNTPKKPFKWMAGFSWPFVNYAHLVTFHYGNLNKRKREKISHRILSSTNQADSEKFLKILFLDEVMFEKGRVYDLELSEIGELSATYL